MSYPEGIRANKFKAWFEDLDLDRNDDFETIWELYHAIRNKDAGGDMSDFLVSVVHGDGLCVFRKDSPELRVELESEDERRKALSFLDSLYPEGGGVIGEESRRHNMGRD